MVHRLAQVKVDRRKYHLWVVPRQKHKESFQGVSAAFHGAELTEFAHGRGRYVVCQYQVPPQLGSDPVADRLLANLLRWVAPDGQDGPAE